MEFDFYAQIFVVILRTVIGPGRPFPGLVTLDSAPGEADPGA